MTSRSVDITEVSEALMAARRQSLDEVLRAMDQHSDVQVATEYTRLQPRELSWEETVAVLSDLPSRESLAERNSPIHARLTTQLGFFVYAITFELVEEDKAIVLGIHCFHNEPIDVERTQHFIVVKHGEVAALSEAERYLNALEALAEGADPTLHFLHVYDAALETMDGVPQA